MIPPVKWRKVRNAVATNHLLFIEIEPDQPFSTLAQEVAEWQHKAALWVPMAIVAGVMAGVAGWHIAAAFGALLFAAVGTVAGAVLGNNLRSGTRAIEYWGRAVDYAAGGDLDTLARRLSGYKQFRHAVPLETIKAEILLREDRAMQWLGRNEAALWRVYQTRVTAS